MMKTRAPPEAGHRGPGLLSGADGAWRKPRPIRPAPNPQNQPAGSAARSRGILDEQELARLWRLLEVAPWLVDPWPDEPGKFAAWLWVQEIEARKAREPKP